MDRMIPAKPTLYNGTVYRSRLEARWAVFFDVLGIQYEYEKEPYTMKYGIRYLPDFVLQNVHWRGQSAAHYLGKPGEPIYVEVKGYNFYRDIPESERIKIEFFAEDHALIVLGAIPKQAADIEQGTDEMASFAFLDGDQFPCFFSKGRNGIWLSNSQHDEYVWGSVDRALNIAILAHLDDAEDEINY